jgi:hypothetical protein
VTGTDAMIVCDEQTAAAAVVRLSSSNSSQKPPTFLRGVSFADSVLFLVNRDWLI